MSVQGQPAVIVPATTQTPKAIIPAKIRNENTKSIIGPLSSREWDRRRRLNSRRPLSRKVGRQAGAPAAH